MRWFWIVIMAASLTLSACIGAGENSGLKDRGDNHFPAMTGIDLLGEERSLPQSFAGEYNLVIIAFQREQQEQVDPWIHEASQLVQSFPKLRFYELPLIYEMSALGRGWVNNGMRSGIPSDAARERTITVYTDRERFFSMMNMQEDSIYPLLLDHEGRILWRGKGTPNAENLAQIKEILQ